MIIGQIDTMAGPVPQVSSSLTIKDFLGAMMVRWSFNRDNYKVEPGIYAVGAPTEASDVFVTANYKLSFDHVRKNLTAIDAWILVLDTKGINVWCAAGKGTFGTKELVTRIFRTKLDQIVNHKRVIVPQLGAVGVSAHEASLKTGFKIKFGPVQASDIKAFIANNYTTTKEMRKVNFTMTDRVKLIPVELMYGMKYLIGVVLLFFILSNLGIKEFSYSTIMHNGLISTLLLATAYLSGTVLTPILLPYLPVRAFALKGVLTGLITTLIVIAVHVLQHNYMLIMAWALIITSVSSFLGMNFTGTSTYTSLSGVKKEMKIAIPLQIAGAAIGLILFIIEKFV